MQRFFAHASVVVGLALGSAACGGGVPVEIRIDEAAFQFDLNEQLDELENSLFESGFLAIGVQSLPEVWPADLPALKYAVELPLPPFPIDLTVQEGDPDYETYKEINDVANVIRRIEINRLALRVEQTTLSFNLPELTLQVADKKDANPDDRRAWFTIGTLPGAEAGKVGDFDFAWRTGGESFLNAQLGDEEKELALRVVGNFGIDTEEEPRLPRGAISLRLIVVATFFVEPEKAL